MDMPYHMLMMVVMTMIIMGRIFAYTRAHVSIMPVMLGLCVLAVAADLCVLRHVAFARGLLVAVQREHFGSALSRKVVPSAPKAVCGNLCE